MKPFVCSALLTKTDQQNHSPPAGTHIRIYLYDLHTFTPVPTNHFSVKPANYHEKQTKRETHKD